MIKNNILKDGISLLIAKFLSIFSGMIISIFVARYYKVDVYGIYTTATAFATFILTFTDLGTDTYLLREGSRDKKLLNKYLGNVIILKLIMLAISTIIMFIVANLIGYNKEIITLMLILIPNFLITYVVNTFFVVMQIKGILSKNARIQFYQNIFRIIAVIIVLVLNYNIYIYAATQSIIAIVIIFMYLPYVKVKTEFTLVYSKKLILGSILFGVSSLLYIIYYKIDVVMLSVIKGTYEVGIYESAYKIVSIVIGLIVILDNIFMPKFFELYKSDKEKMLSLYSKIIRYAIVFGVPVSTILMYISPSIINILYGRGYEDAIFVLQILVWSIAIRLLAAIVGFVITASDNMKVKVKFQILFTIFNLTLNLILIPKFSVVGACIATILTELMVLILYYAFVSKKFIKCRLKILILKAVLCNMIIYFILAIIGSNNVLINGIIFIVLYVGTIFFVFNDEWNFAYKNLIEILVKK